MTLDLRALAAWRIALGLTVLLDLLLRARDLVAFYTDAGALPRVTLLQIPHPTYLGLYMTVGSAAGAALLMLALAAAATGLALGWRTRPCAVLTWVLHIALKHRNPLILDVGDLELGLALFWAIFLPVGARWSLDARAHPAWAHLPPAYRSLATAGYALQIGLIYLMAHLTKSAPAWRETGLALYYCFSYDKFATGLGQSLLGWPGLPQLTKGVLVAEALIPVLLWLPWRVTRWAGLLILLLLQLGIAATMQLGLIPLISVVVAIGLWPGGRDAPEAPSEVPPGYRLSLPTRVFLVLVCLYVLHLNYALMRPQVVVPYPVKLFGYLTRQQQDWTMFAPDPGVDDGWYVARAERLDGGIVDLLRQGEPADLSKGVARIPNQRWRCWLHNLSSRRDPLVCQSFASYLANRWNASHHGPERVKRVELVYVAEPTPLPGQPLVATPITLWVLDCPPPDNEMLIP